MGAKTKKILRVVLLLLVAAVIIAAIALWPYYRMPPESKEALDAKLAGYQAIVTEMASRPKDDRQALDALLAEMDASLGKGGERLWQEGCPPYSMEFLDSKQPDVEKLLGFEERFASMLDGGFLVQHSGEFNADIPNFINLRNFASAQLAAAVKDLQQGRPEQAIGRFDAVSQIIEGFENVPTLLFVLIGMSVEGRYNEAVVYLLPSLSEDDIDKIRPKIGGLPDVRPMLINAMKAETAAYVSLMDRLRTQKVSTVYDEMDAMSNRKLNYYLIRLAKVTGYLTRERYMYLSLASREIGYNEKWLADGAEGQPERLKKEDIYHSPATMFGLPNYANLALKAHNAVQKRQAVLTAMDLELKQRVAEPKTDIELPCGEEKKIVLTSEYGCIVKNTAGNQ